MFAPSTRSLVVLLVVLFGCSNGDSSSKDESDLISIDTDADADSDTDADSDADADTDADTDTGLSSSDTSDTSSTAVSCVPTRYVVQTASAVLPANPTAMMAHEQFSACVDPAGHWSGVKQLWYGDINGTVFCLYTWQVESSNLLAGCTECEWAFQFNWGTPIEDGTTLCTDGWWAPGQLYSPTDVRLGFTSEWGGDPVLWEDTDADQVWTFYEQPFWDLTASFDGAEWYILYLGP